MPRAVSTSQFVPLANYVTTPLEVDTIGVVLNAGTPLSGQAVSIPCRSSVTISFAGFITTPVSNVFNAWIQFYNQTDPATVSAARPVSVRIEAGGEQYGTASVTPIQSVILLPGVYYVEVVVSCAVGTTEILTGGELSIVTIGC